MEANGSVKIGLWMDLGHALFLDYHDHQAALLEDISSPMEPRPREAGEGSNLTHFGTSPGGVSNNENKKNNTEQNHLNTYFQLLEKKVKGKGELLLMGPGITKTQFFNHLRENKHFDDMKIQVFDTEKMTENQVLGLVREKFSLGSKAFS